MNIASSLNEYYFPYTYTMLFSLFLNNPDEQFDIFLLTDTLSDHARTSLQDLASEYRSEIHFLKPDTRLLGSALQGKTEWCLEASFRLTLIDLLPDDVDRVLYIDGDVAILNGITELYNMDFENSDLIAGHDLFSCGDRKQDSLLIHDKAFETIISEDSYFNSGIILYNIEKLRRKEMTKCYFESINSLDCPLPYPDQDILNYVHHGKVRYFDTMKYNFQSMLAVSYNGGYDSDRVRREVTILHYIDKKPWNGGDHIHYDVENIWWDYALQTPFAHTLMTDYIRSSMDDHVYNTVMELKQNNERLQDELKKVSLSVKRLLDNLSDK